MIRSRSDHNFAPVWWPLGDHVEVWGRRGYELRSLVEPIAGVLHEDVGAGRQQRQADEDCYDRYAAGI